MAVDYGAGRENLGSLYTNLRTALANKGAAENLQAQRDIDNRGLFGTGIRSSDVTDLGDLAIRGAEFGQGRKALKMETITYKFDCHLFICLYIGSMVNISKSTTA